MQKLIDVQVCLRFLLLLLLLFSSAIDQSIIGSQEIIVDKDILLALKIIYIEIKFIHKNIVNRNGVEGEIFLITINMNNTPL